MISLTLIFFTVSKRKSTRKFYQKFRIKQADKVKSTNFNSKLTLQKLNYFYDFTYYFYVWHNLC